MNKGKKLKLNESQAAESFLLEAQIKNPERLKMLILSGSNLARNDFMFIMNCKSLIKLDLSSNGLVRFPKEFSLSTLTKLSFLHLHNNQFRNIEDLKPVFETTNLIQLTLHNNPLPINPRIEHFILNVLKKLRVINDRVIFEEERLPDVIVTRPMIKLDLDEILPPEKDSDQKYYIWLLEVQFHCIQYNWVRANPIVKIQRLWRKYWKKKTQTTARPFRYIKKFKEPLQKEEINPDKQFLAQMFNKWKEFSDSMRKISKHMKESKKFFMIKPLDQYNEHERNERVSVIVSRFVNRIRHTVKVKKAIAVMQKYIFPKVMLFQSTTCFYTIAGIQEAGRIMFSKNQRHLLLNFIELYKRSHPGTNPQFKIQHCKSYVAVRQVQQERLNLKKNDGFYPLMLYPSMKCIFLKNKKPNPRKAKTTTVAIRQLSYLTKKNAQLTPAERQRSNKKYQRLCRYIENEYYNNLLEFQCKDKGLFQDLLRSIYYHNTGSCKFQKFTKNTEALSFLDNYSESFVFYFDKILKKTTAAVHIQKCWKRYWNNKTCKQTLYSQIIRTRAAQKIQRFARNQQFSHRVSFDTSLNIYLRDITRNSLYIQIQVYLELKKFLHKLPLYNRMAFWINHTKKDVMVTWQHSRSPFFPTTLKKISDTAIHQGDSLAPADIYFILHYGAKSSLITDASGNSRYVRLQYKNIEAAKKRCAFFALLTYQFKMGFFLRMFTRQLLLDQEYMGRYSERMRSIHGAELKPTESKLILKEKPIVIDSASVVSIKGKTPQHYEPARAEKTVEVEYFQQDDANLRPKKIQETFVVAMKELLPTQSHSNLAIPRLEEIQQKTSIVNEGQEGGERKMVSSLRKNFEKRLSFYDITIEQPKEQKGRSRVISSKTGSNSLYDPSPMTMKEDHKKVDQTQRLNQTDWLRETHRHAEKMREEHSVRMQDNSEREKTHLNRLRKIHTQEKARNINVKFIKESQQMVTNRLKVQKIDQRAKEMRATRMAEEEHQNSFVQKGNFLIKQQAKMKRIRDGYLDEQKRKESVSKAIASRGQVSMTTQHVRTRNIGSRASMSQDRERDTQIHQSPRNSSHRRNSVQTPVPTVQTQRQNETHISKVQLVQSSATEDIYRITRKKDKMIHAVFPQEFYAIDKRSVQIGLPRLDRS